MSEIVKFFCDGMDDTVPFVEAAPATEGFPAINIVNRQWHTIWKPSQEICWWRFEFPMAMSFTDLLLSNASAYSAGIYGSDGGIKLITSTGDDASASGTKTYHVGGFNWYHNAEEINEGIWHEHFDPPGVARKWWHFGSQCPTANLALWHIGHFQLSVGGVEVPIFERPQEVPVIYGVEGDYTTGGYSERSLLHGKKYGWNLKWVGMTDAELALFDGFWNTIQGGERPFVYLNENGLLFYVYTTMRGKMQRGEVIDQGWTIPLRLTIAAEGSVV